MKENKDFNEYYEIKEELGRGPRFGIIYNAIKKETNEIKAIKIMEKKKIIDYLRSRGIVNPTEDNIELYFKGFEKEATNMEILQGENKENMNAVFIDESYKTEDEFAIVMEKCDNNLFDHLADKNEPFNDDEIYEILKQLNKSFDIMHNKRILHNAIKLENILLKYLNEEKTKFIVKLKITDDTCSLDDATNLLSSAIENNNLKIISPEILKGEKYIEKCDLWSIGILIYSLYFKEFPFTGDDEKELIKNIKSIIEEGKLKQINNDHLNDLVKKLLIIDPKNRITWEEYFNHSFFVDNPKNDYRKFYTIEEEIGKCAFGFVYKAIKNDNGEERAIKIISKVNFNTNVSNIEETSYTTYIKYIKNEIDNMTIAQGINKDNQNTVKLYEYFDMRNEFAIIMELCDCDLAHILKERNEKFEINEILEILTQLNNTFKILVEKKVIHRDLKLQNILLKKNNGQNIWKLIDYGVSRQFVTLSRQSYTKYVGTISYMAPEILEGKEYNNKCDLWSLGIIIYNLYFKKMPYIGDTIIAVFNNIKASEKKVLEKTGDENLDDLIDKLLEVNPEKRISWKDYFEHKFFKVKKQKNNN
jgi:serine/threonine protein kinase